MTAGLSTQPSYWKDSVLAGSLDTTNFGTRTLGQDAVGAGGADRGIRTTRADGTAKLIRERAQRERGEIRAHRALTGLPGSVRCIERSASARGDPFFAIASTRRHSSNLTIQAYGIACIFKVALIGRRRAG